MIKNWLQPGKYVSNISLGLLLLDTSNISVLINQMITPPTPPTMVMLKITKRAYLINKFEALNFTPKWERKRSLGAAVEKGTAQPWVESFISKTTEPISTKCTW